MIDILRIPSDTRLRQQRASDPSRSAWVGANAGSGKTFVLSRRVMRLLLAGNDPASILCLTFTKAAAMEMAGRVFDELGRWVRLNDTELAEMLTELGEAPVTAKKLQNARRLFAHALETPGGLKVQTIHAFCERLLQQFAVEANVPGHFEVADEAMSTALLQDARQSVLQRVMRNPHSDLGKAFGHLIDHVGDQGIEDAISAALQQRNSFVDALRAGIEDHDRRLARKLSIGPQDDFDQLLSQIQSGQISQISDNDLRRMRQIAETSTQKTNQQTAGRIHAHFTAASDAKTKVSTWLNIFLTGSGTIRKIGSILTKAVTDSEPALFEQLQATLEQGVPSVLNRRNGLIARANTRSLTVLAQEIINRYLSVKHARGLLDYDDLITKTRRLLSNSEAALWVQYKLDRGLNHVLVDEAQDTSPEQWQVVEALTDAFFHDVGSEKSVPGGHRTVFAVGDEKQSIFSFQGAIPGVFEEKRELFARKAASARLGFERINLNLSFRSSDDVLSAVDQVFADPQLAQSISRSGVEPHQAFRAQSPGSVELWPLIETEKTERVADWRAPVDTPPSSFERLATQIASDISARIDADQIQAGDVLILLRKRGRLMQLINRALKRSGVPVAGMDRLRLSEHIAVRDLIVLGEVLLLPDDDLALATLLKSPLFEYSDDDLLRIAPEREGSLFDALKQSKQVQDVVAREQLISWMNRVDFETPYRLFAHILGSDEGRKRILKRLGMEADDILNAFLDEALVYEKRPDNRGLQGFVSWLTAREDDLKRQMDKMRGEVRIMTAHGAKGLEAKSVYLVDDGSKAVHASHLPRIFDISAADSPSDTPTFLWSTGDRFQQTEIARAHLAQKEVEALDEYRRLLYVGMTRAEDRLIVCGASKNEGLSEDNWYRAVENGLASHMSEVTFDGKIRKIWQRRSSSTQPMERTNSTENAKNAILPQWITSAPPKYDENVRPVTPSQIELDRVATDEPAWSDRFEALGKKGGSYALQRGTLIHELLQYLPEIAPLDREKKAQTWLAHRLSNFTLEMEVSDVLEEVQSVLEANELKPLFGSNARAEVSIAGIVPAADHAISVRGTIDRLVKEDDGLLIVDFKTNQRFPETPPQIPQAYVNQLAAYRIVLQAAMPRTNISAALLWTAVPRLDRLSHDILDEAEQRLRHS